MEMIGLIIQAVLIAAIVGIVAKLILDYVRQMEITWGEYGLGLTVISFVLVPLVVWAGWSTAKGSNLSFNEFKNGWELEAVRQPIICTRDGPCWYEYDCDPYLVAYSCNCKTDKNGSTDCDTCYRTEYHSCPYVTVENNFVVRTTLGNFTIARHRFPDDPHRNRWEPYRRERLPQSVIDRAGVGAPVFWQQASARVKAGRPGPVTMRSTYDNYILASDSTILTQYSGVVDNLKAKNMLPPVSKEIYGHYSERKAYRVGSIPNINIDPWIDKLSYANAALGSEMQGDMHVVLVFDPDLRKAGSNPDEYALALKAYWQNPKNFRDDTLSKNAIVVIIGTEDGRVVSWARAFTGMPLGNERMTTEVRNGLTGASFSSEEIIGNIRAYFEVYAQSVKSDHERRGRLGSIVWGLADPVSRFKRISMTANDSSDTGQGFTYLANEITLTGFQRGMILTFAFLGCAAVWFVAAANGIRDRRSYSGPFDFNHIEAYWRNQWTCTKVWVSSTIANIRQGRTRS